MAINYAALSLRAQALIEANGRPCTFSRLGQSPVDPAKPWRGPTTDAAAVSGPPVSYPNVIAVIALEEYSDDKSGARRPSRMMLLVSAESFPSTAVDLKTLDHVDDGQTNWRICKMDPVMPGAVPLIFQSEVEG